MKFLFGCEESQACANAMRELGVEAYSNDTQECSGGHPEFHLQMDVFEAIDYMTWDGIFLFPPCTKIALCGNSTYGRGMKKHEERLEAIEWTAGLWKYAKSKCNHVGMENPKNVLGPVIGKRTQIIQPWMFGHMEQKETWLWLHGLPKLKPTNIVYDEMMKLPKKERERIHYMSPSISRGKERSKTFPGIARAMATQWTEHLTAGNYHPPPPDRLGALDLPGF